MARFTPQALIFDMDGTMVDSEPLWFEVEGSFAKERGGGDWTHELALTCVGRGTDFTLQTMSTLWGFPLDPRKDFDWIIDRFVGRADALELKPGCRELLDEARWKLPMALASSSPKRLIRAVLERFDLAHYFQTFVSLESVAHPKPAPDVFHLAAGRLGMAPRECVVLEDSLAGATAARAAGTRVIAIPEGRWAGRGYEAVSDAIVKDLFEARKLVNLG